MSAHLWHYTCSDHGAPGIETTGEVLPGAAVSPRLRLLASSHLAWFTDLDVPIRSALGLTQSVTRCDRTARRFRVIDRDLVVPWVEVRGEWPELWGLELAPGAMPRHWYVSTHAVPVVEDERREGVLL